MNTGLISKSTKTQQPISKSNQIGILVPPQTKYYISSTMAVQNRPPNFHYSRAPLTPF
jgi:hypothetical protein